MSLQDWCDEYYEHACAAGDGERQRLVQHMVEARPFWSSAPETCERLLREGREHARRLADPQWELIYRFLLSQRRMDSTLDWFVALDDAARLALETRKPAHDGFPGRVAIYQFFIECLAGVDPMLHEARIREALEYLEAQARGDRVVLANAAYTRLWLEMSLDRLDAAEEVGLRMLGSSDGDPLWESLAYTLLCELAYRRADWSRLSGWAEAGKPPARAVENVRNLAEFTMWSAVVARHDGRDRAARRLNSRSVEYASRVEAPGALYEHAVAAYHEVGGALEIALGIRNDGGTWEPYSAWPAWQECALRLRLVQLLAVSGRPVEAELADCRRAARRMGDPSRMLAKLDRIEDWVARGRPGSVWSWQLGEAYTSV